MTNPYITEFPVYPDLFSGRTKELGCLDQAKKDTITSTPSTPRNLAVLGGWGIGKTSLLNKFSSLISKECFFVKITLTPEKCKDYESFIFTTIDEIHNTVWNREDIPAKVKESISRWKLDSLEIFGVTIKKTEQMKPSLSSILKGSLLKLWNKLNRQISAVIIMFDDLHYLVDLYPNALYDIRGIFQELREAECRFMLVVSGYYDLFHKIRGITEPLIRFFETIELEPFNLQETYEAISLPLIRFKLGLKFNKKAIQMIHEKTKGHPYFITFFAHDILEYKKSGQVTTAFLESNYGKIFSHLVATRFVKDLSIASEKEIKILKKLAEREITSVGEMQKISDVRVYLKRLVEKDLVIKKRRGEYSLYHPLFGEYLKEYN